MRLDEYLNIHKMSLRALAATANLGVATIMRARDGTCIANRRTLNAIVEATDGAVTIADLVAAAVEPKTECNTADPDHSSDQG